MGFAGRPVPSRLGSDHELEYLTGAMGSTGRGIVELTIGGSRADRVAEVDRYMELARAAQNGYTDGTSGVTVTPTQDNVNDRQLDVTIAND